MSKRTKNSELKAFVYAAESGIHGTGLFANRPFEEGDYIGTYWGPQATRNGMYVLWVYEDGADESCLLGRSGRNLLRYLNHSASGNTEFDGFDLYAMTSIAKGEELTFNYGGSQFD